MDTDFNTVHVQEISGNHACLLSFVGRKRRRTHSTSWARRPRSWCISARRRVHGRGPPSAGETRRVSGRRGLTGHTFLFFAHKCSVFKHEDGCGLKKERTQEPAVSHR